MLLVLVLALALVVLVLLTHCPVLYVASVVAAVAAAVADDPMQLLEASAEP